MATVNFYLDSKPDKNGMDRIMLRVICDGKHIKATTGIKVSTEHFDKEKQVVLKIDEHYKTKNQKLQFLKAQIQDFLINSYTKSFTVDEIKSKAKEFVSSCNEKIHVVKEQLSFYGKPISFIDLFAGAGGFSEGFLQAENDNKFYDFKLASDINENCELTHLVRYNYQLGLDAKFLKKDITDPDFIETLTKNIGDNKIDVVCGGPPCQSFSLAGKRKHFDKKDDLFSHYLEVIKVFQPKYFIMENVKGILTKEEGKIKDLIIRKIRSIIDINEIPQLLKFIRTLNNSGSSNNTVLESLIYRIKIEEKKESELADAKNDFVKFIENRFKKLTPKIADYQTSKTDKHINTIRHGLNLLIRNKELELIQRQIIKEKDISYIDNDYFVDSFNSFLKEIETESIINRIKLAFSNLNPPKEHKDEASALMKSLDIYNYTFDDCMELLREIARKKNKEEELLKILERIHLYNIEKPFVANASNYGVPQNRERVLFIGCRKDQKLISEIKPTVTKDEKVSVFEALYDLDFIENNQVKKDYYNFDLSDRYNGDAYKYKKLLNLRAIDGKKDKSGKTYSEWSKEGRLNGRFNIQSPFYVKNEDALKGGDKEYGILHNHQTSNQNKDVLKRLEIILNNGDYTFAKESLVEYGLASKKRNYNVLKPEGQSPTVMTIPDDYIHFARPRALTVREMARLQSFDDSFVFQGKRSTGGNKRKDEVPQYTLVGNAVPPLLARAVAMEILKNIK